MTPLGEHEHSRLRRAAEELFARAEHARDQADLEGAARLFGQAAGTWRSTGDVFEAADAYLELGAVLLHQGRGRILPELSLRLLDLLKVDPLPNGAFLKLRVYAALITQGAEHQGPYLELVHQRRSVRHRMALAAAEEEPCRATC